METPLADVPAGRTRRTPSSSRDNGGRVAGPGPHMARTRRSGPGYERVRVRQDERRGWAPGFGAHPLTCYFSDLLRWVWDLNPRRHRCLDGFQDRSLRPLGQPTHAPLTCCGAATAYRPRTPVGGCGPRGGPPHGSDPREDHFSAPGRSRLSAGRRAHGSASFCMPRRAFARRGPRAAGRDRRFQRWHDHATSGRVTARPGRTRTAPGLDAPGPYALPNGVRPLSGLSCRRCARRG